jgi:hypothetical protein
MITLITPITNDPETTTAAHDFQNYLAAVNFKEPAIKKDVRDHVNERLEKVRDRNWHLIYPKPEDREAVLQKFDGYRDSELGGPRRLGNALPKTPPETKDNKVLTPAEVEADSGKNYGFKVIDGVVIHTDTATGTENPAAHHYMHEIFDHILYTSRDLLEAINLALERYCGTPDKPETQKAAMKQAYREAVAQFYAYTKSFEAATDPSPYATTFNSIEFKPVVTNEGFFVSLRIHINWKNPRHSSSTISVP